MQILNATAQDIPRLAEIYSFEYGKLNIGEEWTPPKAVIMLNYWLKKQPDLAFVVKEEGNIIGGFFGGIKPWWDGNHLVDFEIFVDSNVHGKGIGKQLLRHAITVAKEKYQIVCVDPITYTDHDFPLSWYKKLGFETVDNLVILTAKADEVLEKLK